MALYFPEKDALWLAIPKTGCQWIRKAILESGIPVVPIDTETHGHINQHVLARHTPYPHAKFVFGFVRHPLSWYESWWKYQAKAWDDCVRPGWHPQRQLAKHCRSDNFRLFIKQCLEYEPGYVTRLTDWYFGPEGAGLTQFVGRYENLAADLAKVLQHLGYAITQEQLEARPPLNVSAARAGQPVWDPLLRRQMLASEAPMLRRFYPDSSA